MPRHGSNPQDIVPPISKYQDSGRFGRMFGKLPGFATDTPKTRKSLLEIGKAGGIMDAMENLAADPTLLITDANLSAGNQNNPKLSAGMTFLGQFLDHDMSLDISSSLTRQTDPEMIANVRTPNFGLDSVYGSGPRW